MGIAVGIVCTVLSAFFVRILYGVDYLEASNALTISIWYGTFAQLATTRGVWALCKEKNKYVKYYLVLGTIINFVLNYFLIQSFVINGVAIATLATQIFVSLITTLFHRETRLSTKLMVKGICLAWWFEK